MTGNGTERKARVAVIGVGWWGVVGHLEPLSQDPKADVVAVYSRTEEKARQRAERFNVPRYYTDYRKLIDECELDGVIIATTPNMHYEQALYALERGLPVLMEKPFVLKAEHAEHLGRLAQEKGLILSVCHPLLRNPWLNEARRYVQEGRFGKLLTISKVFAQRTIDLYRGDVPGMFARRPGQEYVPDPTSYSDPDVVGGGQGHTQSSHAIGEILWLTGAKPRSVFAYMDNLDTKVDVINAMVIRFEGGLLATLISNGNMPHRTFMFETQLIGEKGIFSIDSPGMAAHVQFEGEEKPRKLEFTARENWTAMVPRNFVRAILGEEPIHTPMELAIDEVKILDAAYRSAASGQPVEIQ